MRVHTAQHSNELKQSLFMGTSDVVICFNRSLIQCYPITFITFIHFFSFVSVLYVCASLSLALHSRDSFAFFARFSPTLCFGIWINSIGFDLIHQTVSLIRRFSQVFSHEWELNVENRITGSINSAICQCHYFYCNRINRLIYWVKSLFAALPFYWTSEKMDEFDSSSVEFELNAWNLYTLFTAD